MANPNPDTTGLILFQDRTEKEQRKLASEGGKASGRARRKKRNMSELAALIGDSPMMTSAAQKLVEIYPELEDEDITANAAIIGNATWVAATSNKKDAIVAAEWLRQRQQEAAGEAERAKFTLSALNFTIDFLHPYREATKALEPYSEAEKSDETLRAKRVRELISKGGRGSIKSSFWASFAYEQMMNDTQAHIVFTRRYKVDLKDSVWSQWMRTVDRLGNLDDWTFNVSPMRAVYKPTGQIVYFLGADKPISKKSFEVPFGYIKLYIAEECDEMQGIEQLDQMEDTFLRKDTPALSIKIFNPPASKSNFMNEYTAMKETEPSTIVCHSYYYNVPVEWLGQRFFDRAEWFKEHKPLYYKNNYEGEAVGTGGELFNNVTERKITKREIANLDVYQGLDWGYEHPQVFMRVAYNPDTDTLYILKEHYRHRPKLLTFLRSIAVNKKTRKVDPDLLEMYAEQETIADSANPDKIRDAQDYGWNVIPAVKRWKGGGRAYGWEWLRSVREIVVDPALCPNIAKEFRTLEFEKLKDGTFTSAYPKLGEDGVAAVTYAMNRVIMAAKDLEDYTTDEELIAELEAEILDDE